MQKPEKTACPYDNCYLPNNNKKYVAQGVYLVISTLYLLKSQKEFTFFAILLYATPILLDILSTELRGNIYNFFAKAYTVLNIVLVIFCLLGMSGLFVDGGDVFSVVDTAMIFAEASFSKRILIFPMVANILIPVLLYNGCPSKETKWMLECARKRKETTT